MLHLVRDYGNEFAISASDFNLIEGAPVGVLTDLLFQCGYLTSVNEPRLTPKGLEASLLLGGEPFAHRLLKDYLRNAVPNWSGVVRQGRAALANYSDREVLQCFDEAGLFRLDLVAARWWDEIFLEHKDEETLERLRIGRRGEEKSFQFETERTGIEPEWISLFQPTSPYDLLSFTSSQESERLVIEVKASSLNAVEAQFYLSSQEWRMLSTARHAVLHLWAEVDNDSSEPHIVLPAALSSHVPVDVGDGSWRTATIPFESVML